MLRGCHHAMESFYEMQQSVGGIVGPEGPGWPRLGPMVPAAVREHFIDEHALPAPSGELFPRPTQCLMGTHSRSLLCCKSVVVQI